MKNVTKYLSMLMVVLSILIFASQTQAQSQVLYTQDWSTGSGYTPPSGWAVDAIVGGDSTYWDNVDPWWGNACYPGCTEMAIYGAWNSPVGYQNRLKMTTPISTAGKINITVDFTEYLQNNYASGDGVTIEWSTNGTTWTSTNYVWLNYTSGSERWVINTQALPSGANNQSALYVAFYFYSDYGLDDNIDIMHINGTPTGTLAGNVKNHVTNGYLANVNVYCGSSGNWVGPAVTNSSGNYTLSQVPSGSQTVSAVLANFTTYTGSTTINANLTTTDNFLMWPLPGIITGVVTDTANNNPVIGAYITWGNYYTYSVAGGLYTLDAYSYGTNTLTITKEGFGIWRKTGVNIAGASPPNVTVNAAISEDTPPPSSPFVAALNSGQTAVNLNWNLPVDNYDLIYDDGIQDNFGIYLTGNGANLNAVKFTPVGYPAIIKGLYYNIGNETNYRNGWNPFEKVQFTIYNETGGLPGSVISDSLIITPAAYGWNKASFATPVTIASGDFFIVMTQLGADSISPGIAIDTTTYQMRSYSKMGSTPWLPAPGNYMIRAIVNGSGGPLDMDNKPGKSITASPIPGMIYEYTPSTITGVEGSTELYPEYNPDAITDYQVWRLLQGQESTPASWTSVGTTTSLSTVDNSWPSLPCDPYRWAVEAQYTFNRWSTATFSNAVGKCWTCTVIVDVNLSCDSVTTKGVQIILANVSVPDTVYNAIMDASGSKTFSNFWKGTYNLTVSKYGYTPHVQNGISIMGDMTITVALLQMKTPPTGLVIHDTDAYATWNPPVAIQTLFSDDFSSDASDFSPNWVADAGSNWEMYYYFGNPSPCAVWYYYPEIENKQYSQSLTSKTIVGVNSPVVKLQYDIYLEAESFWASTNDLMAVEVWDGTTWNTVADYDATSSFSSFTTKAVDIASVAPSSGFKIRFRAHGDNSALIWAIDNVKVLAESVPHDPCVIGYDFYLNGIVDGFTPDTVYRIPPSHLSYGTSYLGCVAAIYGSGYSTQICQSFTDHFLCPPDTVTATPIECSALVTWKKPDCNGCTPTSYVFDDGTYWNGQTWYSGTTIYFGNYFPLSANASGFVTSFDIWFTQYGSWTAQSTEVYIYSASHTLLGQSASFINNGASWPSGTWIHVTVPNPVAYTGPFYGMVNMTGTGSMINGMGMDGTTVISGQPNGLAWVDESGTWTNAVSFFGYPAPETWSERVNVCSSSKKDAPITTIDPSKIQPSVSTSNPAAAYSTIGANSGIATVDPPASYNSPEAPAAGPVQTGYDIYRNGLKIAYFPYPDSLQYYDYNLAPGTYTYTVDAKYNVSPFVPDTAFSRKAVPVGVANIFCGYPIPFYEPWNSGFSYQQWTFSPNQGHWSISSQEGNPVPCADFSWEPVQANYTFSLITPGIDASAWTCADIYCDFDLKLVDVHATGTEKLDLDINNSGGSWQNKAEFADSGSYTWRHKHINITAAALGSAFQIRFNAHGANSSNILHWDVDNVHVYGVCRPPTSLKGKENQFVTTLTWNSPRCPVKCTPTSLIYDDGTYWNGQTEYTGITIYMGNYFPLSNGASGTIKSFDIWFTQYGSWTAQSCNIYIFDGNKNQIGESASFVNNGASWPSGTWVNVPIDNISYSGPFYAMVDYTASSNMKNGMGMDGTTVIAGQPNGIAYVDESGTWTDAVTFFGYPAPETWSIRANVCASSSKDDAITTIDPSSMMQKGLTFIPPDASTHTDPLPAGSKSTSSNSPSENNRGLTIPEAPEGSKLLGYNVWRTPDYNLTGNYIKVNSGYVSDSTYKETHQVTLVGPASWKYYVTAEFQDSLNPGVPLCEPTSDTILINFPAVGINELSNSISLYPNPANDVVNIVSSNDIMTIEVLNYVGQTIYKNNDVNQKTAKLDVNSFNAGVYFVKITTTEGIKTSKITVTH